MDWDKLIIPTTKQEIASVTKDHQWQEVRRNLIGKSLATRFDLLENWLKRNKHSHESKIQVANYVNALKRGGMIPTT